MTLISYAQNFEDVMLFRALRGVEKGFYIDVGAQDPIEDSVTRAFYERGWRGINIEPVEHWYKRLVDDRPRDVNLRVAVSDHPGELKLFEVEGTGLSTTDEVFLARHRAEGLAVHEHLVECVTLDRICTEHQVGTVHFLKVDCEGAEAPVLRGMPLQRVRPWIILVEAIEPNSMISTHQQWEHLLVGNGYAFVYADGINRYYLAEEHPELRAALSTPPNVLDDFMRAGEDRAHRRVHDLHETLLKAGAEARAQIAESADLRREVVRLQGEVAAFYAEHTELRAEIAHRVQQALGLEHEIARLQQEYRGISAEREELRSVLAQMRASRSWRLTEPLRFANRGLSTIQGMLKRGIKSVLRPAAQGLRPMLRRLVHHPAARRLVLGLVGGRDSPIARRMRVFLFGPLHIATPYRIARVDGELDSSVYSRRERVALAALQRAIPSATDNEE
jgi:FkbM family methyltransferase